jgi:hypothetical protein
MANEHPIPDPDALAAHDFLSELRTRITTQPLPYQYGTEARALESLWEVFGQARAAMKRNPGCSIFAEKVSQMLNVDLRPVTAKWHRAYAEGLLDSRDGADEFRADLAAVQKRIRAFAEVLQKMAYGSAKADHLTPPVMTPADLDDLCGDLRFGIDDTLGISANDAAGINSAERAEVDARRLNQGIATRSGYNAVGIGLSGGGIRSATFCLGIIQVLAERRLLKEVDFLSTVSGGGYTGSFLTSRLGTGSAQSDLGGPRGPDPEPIRYLRHHAKYLAAANLKQAWSMVTASLAGMLLNWTAPILIIVLAGLSLRLLPCAAAIEARWLTIMTVSSMLTGLSLVLYGVLMRKQRKAAQFGGALLGILTAATAVISFGWLLNLAYKANPNLSSLSLRGSSILALVATAGPMILRFLPILETAAARRMTLKVLLAVAGVIVPLTGILLFFAVLNIGGMQAVSDLPTWNPLHYGGAGVLIVVAVFLAFISIFVLNINLTSPHRMYRDMLAETFIKRSETDDPVIGLKNVNACQKAPYHLINTTVNLPSSSNSALRDRKADFFLFSKWWCGSPVVGYHRTTEWKMNASSPDLATAMAVSGAAASSHMGLGSMPTLVALLTVLNVRLGFWIRRPGHNHFPQVPGFTCLMREMIGVAMSEKKAWLNLSDGGHIENMATYELLRRRCKFIICVDGEADPGFTFLGLMTLVRHAALDFGIRIEPHLDTMRPNPKTGLSQTHGIMCRIHYPEVSREKPAAIGLLLYMKLSVTGNESELVRRYRTICPDFPHQSTLDQFFGEEQFEAYRQLGVHAVEGMFSRGLMGGTDSPTSTPEWFKRLAGNLLEKE